MFNYYCAFLNKTHVVLKGRIMKKKISLAVLVSVLSSQGKHRELLLQGVGRAKCWSCFFNSLASGHYRCCWLSQTAQLLFISLSLPELGIQPEVPARSSEGLNLASFACEVS